MNILDENKSLETILYSTKKKNIVIVTAFASGTEHVIDLLVKNDNHIELVVGTINAFSSPEFIKHCASITNNNLSIFIDFRYQNSTHWKLYLIEPNIVIIGSANFTSTGIKLNRDTCIKVENDSLYKAYMKKTRDIIRTTGVIGSNDKTFSKELKKYILNHKRMQAGMNRSKQYTTVDQWLQDESNQSIPLFIWDQRLTKQERKRGNELLEEIENNSNEEHSKPPIRDFFTYECNKGEMPYEQGDIVLCANSKGASIGFYCFDRVLYEDGVHYIYSYKRKRYATPFRLNEIKDKLKKLIQKLYDDDRVEISRADFIKNYVSNAT